MTQADIDAEVMRRLREHEENEKVISCLRSKLQRARKGLMTLDLEQEELDSRALGQAMMDLRDTNPRADLTELKSAILKREDIRSFMKTQGFPSFGG